MLKLKNFLNYVAIDANSYRYNDLLKFFLQRKLNLGKKLTISEHGGSFVLKYSKFYHTC